MMSNETPQRQGAAAPLLEGKDFITDEQHQIAEAEYVLFAHLLLS